MLDTYFRSVDSLNYGKSTKKDLHEKELKFELGIVKSDGKPMLAKDDLTEMLRLWEKSQAALKLLLCRASVDSVRVVGGRGGYGRLRAVTVVF